MFDGVAAEHVAHRPALHLRRGLDARQVQDGGRDVGRGRQRLAPAGLDAGRPNDERHPIQLLVERRPADRQQPGLGEPLRDLGIVREPGIGIMDPFGFAEVAVLAEVMTVV